MYTVSMYEKCRIADIVKNIYKLINISLISYIYIDISHLCESDVTVFVFDFTSARGCVKHV